MCIRDSCQLTQPICWPLPTLEEIFDTVIDKYPKLLTNIDMKHAYFQVFLDEESRPKAAFTGGGKFYVFTRMSMGLNNSAQTWQRLFTKVLYSRVLLYIWMDIMIMNRDFPEHYDH